MSALRAPAVRWFHEVMINGRKNVPANDLLTSDLVSYDRGRSRPVAVRRASLKWCARTSRLSAATGAPRTVLLAQQMAGRARSHDNGGAVGRWWSWERLLAMTLTLTCTTALLVGCDRTATPGPAVNPSLQPSGRTEKMGGDNPPIEDQRSFDSNSDRGGTGRSQTPAGGNSTVKTPIIQVGPPGPPRTSPPSKSPPSRKQQSSTRQPPRPTG
jgi:hypothetical protein